MKRLTMIFLGLGCTFSMLHNIDMYGMNLTKKYWVNNNLTEFQRKLSILFYDEFYDIVDYKKFQNLHFSPDIINSVTTSKKAKNFLLNSSLDPLILKLKSII